MLRCILSLLKIRFVYKMVAWVGFHEVVGGLHDRLSDFIHRVVVMRRDEVIRSWRKRLRGDPLVRPNRWLRPDLVPPAVFLQCDPGLTPGGSGVLTDPARIDDEFRVKLGFPFFVALGKGKPAWRNSMRRLRFGCLCWLRFICPP